MPPTRSLRPKRQSQCCRQALQGTLAPGECPPETTGTAGICLLNPQSTQRTKSPRSRQGPVRAPKCFARRLQGSSTPHRTLGPEAWTQTGRRAEIIPSGESSYCARSRSPPRKNLEAQLSGREGSTGRCQVHALGPQGPTTHLQPDLAWAQAVPTPQTHSPKEAGAARGERAQAKKGLQTWGQASP